MTTTTATVPGRKVRRLRGLWPTYFSVLFGNAWYAWFWAVMILIYAGIAAGIALWGTTDISLWETSTNSTKGTMAAMGVMSVPAFLPLMVAAGVTRRSFVVGVTAAIGTLATGSSLLLTIGYVIERPIYEAYGIPENLSTNHLFTDSSQLHLIFTESLIVQLAYAVSGLLIGLCFYRFGPFPGLLLIAPCAITAAGTEVLLTGGTWFGPVAGDAFGAGWPVWLQIVVPVLAIAVSTVILRAVAIGTALRPRKN
ncbi:hypothetical protein [Phytomonospora endophytica]|uniref:Uncharacterized protein n=1 Tax=Phytomonospora endophytica TaxID=714109 RepID=A0A841FB56_9ACTN|nr:hypothetical protein [Phytomonospora endophytica]MBB6032263.1 hypothetical protein [Phytomonospora endophytica]GIG68613.1 hypothetical protein Pen01_49080 [Phytomonospora endophytica]